MKRGSRIAVLALGGLLGGCGLLGIGEEGPQPVCTLEARPGITVRVQTEAGAVPADGTALVVAFAPSFADSARVHAEGTASLAYERAGTYTVEVQRAGYETWRRSGVRVEQGECHVETVMLEAVLKRVG